MEPDPKTREYLQKLGAMKLSETARARMHDELLSYARFHAVPTDVRVESEARSIGVVRTGTLLQNISYYLTTKRMTAALVIALLVATGGTSFAAEASVPGDALYPVKVEVNEKVKSALALSNSAEAKLQARLAAERLQEAETLAARGELNAVTAAMVGTRLKEHVVAAEERSDRAEAESDLKTGAEVRASLEGSLRSYIEILGSLNAGVSGNDGTSLIVELSAYADTAARAQATATAEVSADVHADVEALVDLAGVRVNAAQTQLERAQATLDAAVAARITTRLEAAAAAHAEAKASLEAEIYREAYAAAQTAVRITEEVQTSLESALRLDTGLSTGTTGVGGTLDVNTGTTIEGDTNSSTQGSTDGTQTGGALLDVETETVVDVDTSINTPILDADATVDTDLRTGTELGL